jgi:CRISPR-associated protein Cas2
LQALVAFDIADNQRRDRLTRVLLDYGQRVQESVFWLECEDELLERIRQRMCGVIDSGGDNLWMIVLCRGCARRVETWGQGRKPVIPEFFIF